MNAKSANTPLARTRHDELIHDIHLNNPSSDSYKCMKAFLAKSCSSFSMIRIIDTAIHGTYGCALGLIVKPDTFRAFVRNDIVQIWIARVALLV